MITRPSVSELLAGLTKNFEALSEANPGDVRHLLVPALSILDRVGNEWSSWSALLEADNADIRETLESLGFEVAASKPDVSAFASRQSQHAVSGLETENRHLRDALVNAIEHFDLPADPGASAAGKHADTTILALLRRMLYREDSVCVAPSRTVATAGNPTATAVSHEHLRRVLLQFLASEMPDASGITLENLQPLAGGASREAWVFDVRWRESNEERFEECILMREPVASVLVSDDSASIINGTRRTVASEIRVIKAMAQAGMPVPSVLWHDPEGQWLERPFSVSRRLQGSADVTGLVGTDHASHVLGEFVEILARLHQLDPEAVGLGFLGSPTRDTAALDQVAQFERNFNAQRLEAYPATTYIIRWLRKNSPRAGKVSVVHGDYRLGNFLYDDKGIVAILDWEQAHVGDPIEEIAFMYWTGWSLETICPIDEFVRRYEHAAQTRVDRQTLAYYRAFIEFKMLVVLLTGLKSFYATPEFQLHYGSAQTTEMIRDAQLRVIEALHAGGPTVEFDAYRKSH